jgi:hypothetical protein
MFLLLSSPPCVPRRVRAFRDPSEGGGVTDIYKMDIRMSLRNERNKAKTGTSAGCSRTGLDEGASRVALREYGWCSRGGAGGRWSRMGMERGRNCEGNNLIINGSVSQIARPKWQPKVDLVVVHMRNERSLKKYTHSTPKQGPNVGECSWVALQNSCLQFPI